MSQDIHPELIDGVTDTEQYEIRKNQILRNLMMDYYDPLNIEGKPDGMDYRWVRHTVLGDPAFSQVGLAKAKGWTEVPRYRHPDLYFLDNQGTEQRSMWIEFKGNVLMERPEFFGKEELKKLNSFHLKQIQSAAGDSQYSQRNGGPIRVISDSVTYSANKGSFKE
jgi:hypothetical protein